MSIYGLCAVPTSQSNKGIFCKYIPVILILFCIIVYFDIFSYIVSRQTHLILKVRKNKVSPDVFQIGETIITDTIPYDNRATIKQTQQNRTFYNDFQDSKCAGWALLDMCFCNPGFKESNCNDRENKELPAYEKMTIGDDRRFYHPQYGVAVVNEKRWNGAQNTESVTWKSPNRKSDRQDEHTNNFRNYASLSLFDHELGDILEMGSGPFTNTKSILASTGLSPKSITLVDPLIDEYYNSNPYCTYKNDVLLGHKVIRVNATAEDFRAPEGKQFDTIVLINMIEHVRNAFLAYQNIFSTLKEGGVVIFHERFWPNYNGLETKNMREWLLHPIRLNKRFAHALSSRFELYYEYEFLDPRWPGTESYYWIGRLQVNKRQFQYIASLNQKMLQHNKYLQDAGFTQENTYGNVFNKNDQVQSNDYASYASQEWIRTICEVGFAAGHTTVIWTHSNPNVSIFSFDDYGKPNVVKHAYSKFKSNKITLIRGNSMVQVPDFVMKHFPKISCDLISIDGAHHANYPAADMDSLRLIASARNIVLIDDFSSAWPAVHDAVMSRKSFLTLRHQMQSIWFRGKPKQWAVAQYELLTIVVQGFYEERVKYIESLIKVSMQTKIVQQFIVIWNGNSVPFSVSNLKRRQIPGGLTITIVHELRNSLNNRFNSSRFNLHTNAVLMLDDDIEINKDTLSCLFNSWKTDPGSVFSVGAHRIVKSDQYKVVELGNNEANFLLPRMIFHRKYMDLYMSPQFNSLREYVDTQEAHCDDIAFSAIVTHTTKRPLVYVKSSKGKSLVVNDIGIKLKMGLGKQYRRVELRTECSTWILKFLNNHIMPPVQQHTC